MGVVQFPSGSHPPKLKNCWPYVPKTFQTFEKVWSRRPTPWSSVDAWTAEVVKLSRRDGVGPRNRVAVNYPPQLPQMAGVLTYHRLRRLARECLLELGHVLQRPIHAIS